MQGGGIRGKKNREKQNSLGINMFNDPFKPPQISFTKPHRLSLDFFVKIFAFLNSPRSMLLCIQPARTLVGHRAAAVILLAPTFKYLLIHGSSLLLRMTAAYSLVQPAKVAFPHLPFSQLLSKPILFGRTSVHTQEGKKRIYT